MATGEGSMENQMLLADLKERVTSAEMRMRASFDLVKRAALRSAVHQYDDAEDPGWEAELDDEIFQNAIETAAAEINVYKTAKKNLEQK